MQRFKQSEYSFGIMNNLVNTPKSLLPEYHYTASDEILQCLHNGESEK